MTQSSEMENDDDIERSLHDFSEYEDEASAMTEFQNTKREGEQNIETACLFDPGNDETVLQVNPEVPNSVLADPNLTPLFLKPGAG